MTSGQYKTTANIRSPHLRRYNALCYLLVRGEVCATTRDAAPEAESVQALLIRLERRTPDAEGYSRLLARLVAERLIGAHDASTYAGQPPAEAVAELIAHMRAVNAIADARARSGEQP